MKIRVQLRLTCLQSPTINHCTTLPLQQDAPNFQIHVLRNINFNRKKHPKKELKIEKLLPVIFPLVKVISFITVINRLTYIFDVDKKNAYLLHVNYAKPENVAPLKYSVFKSYHAVNWRETDSFDIIVVIL